jgi:hypothetical protein
MDRLRTYWENLTDRERRAMSLLGVVVLAFAVGLPVYLLSITIDELEQRNAEITGALRRISHERGRIAAMRSAQAARDARYEAGAPGETWLPAQVQEQGLSVARVQQEPERVEGRYRILTTRASVREAGLRSSILLLTELKNSRYPVAIERLHIDHHQSGDRYNLEIGVLTFERQRPNRRSNQDAGVPAGNAPTERAPAPAGPPAP